MRTRGATGTAAMLVQQRKNAVAAARRPKTKNSNSLRSLPDRPQAVFNRIKGPCRRLLRRLSHSNGAQPISRRAMNEMPIMLVQTLIDQANAAMAQGASQLALKISQDAVAAAPDDPAAINTLGMAQSMEMMHGEAEASFASAVKLAPQIAAYHINYGFALILKGEFEEAEAELMKALQIDPASAAAYQNLTWIKSAKPGDEMISKLEGLRADSSKLGAERSQICFALGKCYDDVGEYDLAFACFKEANDVIGSNYDKGLSEQFFSAIKQVWTQPALDLARPLGYRDHRPVFIIGMPRCGSSLLETKLAGHPQVAALGERSEITRVSEAIARHNPSGRQYPGWAIDLPISAYHGFGKLYVEKFEGMFPTAIRWIDKNLLNFAFVGLIRAMLPDALLLDCRRSSLDTCLSCYFQNLRGGHHYKFRLETLGHFYRLYHDLMEHWRAIDDSILRIDYESLVADSDGEVARLLSAMNLAPAAGRGGAVYIKTSSAFQARQPVFETSIARWKNYEKHIAPLADALGDLAR